MDHYSQLSFGGAGSKMNRQKIVKNCLRVIEFDCVEKQCERG